MQVFSVPAAALLVLVQAGGAEAKPTAAELRRWEGSSNCSGEYTVVSSDKIDECTPFIIPKPASILVEYQNETTYASYHYQGVTDCSGSERKHLSDWTVGSCEDLGGFSQKRVWVEAPTPPPGKCSVPGDCGRAYQACCLASKLKGNGECGCHLREGSGEAGAADCGTCGRAFVTCCSAFKLTGHACTCDVAHLGAGEVAGSGLFGASFVV